MAADNQVKSSKCSALNWLVHWRGYTNNLKLSGLFWWMCDVWQFPSSMVLPTQQVEIFSLPKGYKGKKAHNSIFLVYSPLYCYTNSTDFILCVNNTTCTCTDVFTITTKDQSGGRKLYIAETRLSHVRGHSHNDMKECACTIASFPGLQSQLTRWKAW